MATENDIVLIYMEDSPVFFARVEEIWPDVKKDWFNIELLVLQIPVKVIVWTLKDIYINGTEFFMGGKKMRIEVINAPRDNFITDDENDDEEDKPDKTLTQFNSENKSRSSNNSDQTGQVISLAAFQKKKKDSQ